MADEYVKEMSMEDSFIYKSFNASNSLIEKLVKYLRTAITLDSSFIEEQYMQMKKVAMSPLATKVIDAYDRGDIELLYSRESKVGTTIPFIIRRNQNNKVVATIFIATFGVIDGDNNLNIPVKQLYALMESAYVAWRIQTNPTAIQRNVGLMRICASVYTAMFMRIYNKMYALTTDRPLHDKVAYSVTRFFLERVWEYPNSGLVDSYARADLQYIDSMDFDLLKTDYENAQIKSLNDLVQFTGSLSPRLTNLNTRYFIEQFVNVYHGASIMAMDYLPYVFFVIINVILSSFLISQTALNDLIKNIKGINKFYSELSKTI